MSAEIPTTVEPTWADPSECPFCGAVLPDPGAGFIDHIDDHPACDRGFETWRERVAGDIGGEWSG